VIKTGEHGAMLFGKGEHEFFRTGAFPLEGVEDPTGAGDCFLGGLAGALAATGKDEITFDDLKASLANGTVMASFNCEQFSVEGLTDLTDEQVGERLALFKRYTQL